jgi:hypothetical protein
MAESEGNFVLSMRIDKLFLYLHLSAVSQDTMVVPFVKTVFGQKEDKTQLFKKLALTF